MLEVGYLKLVSPIAIISSRDKWHEFGSSAGLLMLDDLMLEDFSSSELQAFLKNSCQDSAIGFSTKCSEESALLDAGRIARENHFLMELDVTEGMDVEKTEKLLSKINRCGTTLSLRVAPENLDKPASMLLKRWPIHLLHLDLRNLDGSGPNTVKKISDLHGPIIMALANIGDFDDAKSFFAMGADVVSMGGPDPEFADWLAKAMKEYEHLSGWYNAPKHICSGGDLRGLSFCCPPVKHCPVMGALHRMKITPEAFIERKLQLAKGTPLERGEGTCFGSLVWCCKASKPCHLRNSALRRMGLSYRDYMILKRKLAESLLQS